MQWVRFLSAPGGRCVGSHGELVAARVLEMESPATGEPERSARDAGGRADRREGLVEVVRIENHRSGPRRSSAVSIGQWRQATSLSLVAKDIEWIIPGEDWPLAAVPRARGIGGSASEGSDEMETTYPEPPEFVAQGVGVLVVVVRDGENQNHK